MNIYTLAVPSLVLPFLFAQIVIAQTAFEDLPRNTVAAIEIQDWGNVSKQLADIYHSESLAALSRWELVAENTDVLSLNVERILIALQAEANEGSTMLRFQVVQSADKIERFLTESLKQIAQRFHIHFQRQEDKPIWTTRDHRARISFDDGEIVMMFGGSHDSWAKPEERMRDSRLYKRMASSYGSSQFVRFFVGANLLQKWIRAMEGREKSASFAMLEAALSDFVGCSGGMSLSGEGDSFRIESDLTVFPALPHENLAKIFNLAPINIEDDIPIPAKSSLVLQCGLRLESFLEGLQGTINRSANSNFYEEGLANQVEAIYGLNLTELILNSFTGRFCAAFHFSADSPVLANPLNFLIELKNPKTFEPFLQSMNRPQAEIGFQVPEREVRKYQGLSYFGDTQKFLDDRKLRLRRLYEKAGKDWNDPPIPEMTQMILGDYFLSCNSEAELKSYVEAYNRPGDSLTRDRSYTELVAEMTSSNFEAPICAFAYFSNGDFLRYLVTRQQLRRLGRTVRDMGQWYLDDEPNGYDQLADLLDDFPMDRVARFLPKGAACIRIDRKSSAIHLQLVFLLNEGIDAAR